MNTGKSCTQSRMVKSLLLTAIGVAGAMGTLPAQAQKTEGNKNSSKSTSPAPKTSSNSVNVPQISGLNPSPPPRKTTVKKEGSSTAVVKPEKKKVESPKPTGESFIPVQRPE